MFSSWFAWGQQEDDPEFKEPAFRNVRFSNSEQDQIQIINMEGRGDQGTLGQITSDGSFHNNPALNMWDVPEAIPFTARIHTTGTGKNVFPFSCLLSGAAFPCGHTAESIDAKQAVVQYNIVNARAQGDGKAATASIEMSHLWGERGAPILPPVLVQASSPSRDGPSRCTCGHNFTSPDVQHPHVLHTATIPVNADDVRIAYHQPPQSPWERVFATHYRCFGGQPLPPNYSDDLPTRTDMAAYGLLRMIDRDAPPPWALSKKNLTRIDAINPSVATEVLKNFRSSSLYGSYHPVSIDRTNLVVQVNTGTATATRVSLTIHGVLYCLYA